jgi:FAD/FMN-containing dehydrogenase
MRRELELRRAVLLAPRGGSVKHRADFVFLPASTEQTLEAFERARRLAPKGELGVTLAGAERSFEAHFVPKAGARPSIVVSSKRLRGGVELLGEAPTERGEPALRVRALAGTSFGELLRAVHATGGEFMPFSCPTAEAISLAGALAVNTHGRTSSTYGGLFADHVRRFRLVGSDGRVYDCRKDAAGELERELFRYAPGALGSLGLVTEIELELCAVSPKAEVVVEVLEAHRGDALAAVRSYVERVADNRNQGFRPWSEGLSLVLFGAPPRGTSVVMGRRRGGRAEPSRGTLPLFRESAELNLFVQAFSHRFPPLARALASRMLAPGKSFRAEYYHWAFFQSSYDEGAARLERKRPLVWEALGLLPELGLVHQAWVVDAQGLGAFVTLAGELFDAHEFVSVADSLEFFDVLPLPPPSAPLDASRSIGGDAHVVTLSIAVHDPGERERAEAFCRELTERAVERRLPLVVQLCKQHHAEPAILRRMYEVGLGELARVKHAVDPDRVRGSRSLERLGL